MSHYQMEEIEKRVIDKLRQLKPDLTYHCLDHTLDVLEQAERIAREENVSDKRDIDLLKIAALYHDTGFLQTYAQHERRSVEIFLNDFRDSGMSEDDKQAISRLIMVTQIPQRPENLMEQIICDADLDYLGRDDFPKISDELRKEFIAYGVVSNDEEWYALQLKFLKSHQYHTSSSRTTREIVKQKNFQALL